MKINSDDEEKVDQKYLDFGSENGFLDKSLKDFAILGSGHMNMNETPSNSEYHHHSSNEQWEMMMNEKLLQKRPASFTNQDAPIISKRSHPCTWPGCGKLFLRKTDVTRHLRIHLNERPFVCEWPNCGKSFMQRSAMKIHYRTHTGEKPNKCPFEGCGKAFNDSSSLARHRRTHRFNEPFPCSYRPCPEHFKTRKLLMEHERGVHNAPAPTRKNGKLSVNSHVNLPTPTATPDSTPNRSENIGSQLIFHSNFNGNQSFENGDMINKNTFPPMDMNNRPHSPKSRLQIGFDAQRLDQRSAFAVNDHTQARLDSYPSAFHESFLSKKLRSTSFFFDPNGKQSPSFLPNQPLSSSQPPIHHVNQIQVTGPNTTSTFDGQFYHYPSTSSGHMNSQSALMMINNKSTFLDLQEYPQPQRSNHSSLEPFTNSSTNSSASMNAFIDGNSLQNYAKFQDYTPFEQQSTSLLRKCRPPRIQTDVSTFSFQDHQHTAPYSLESEDKSLKGPQTAREDRIGGSSNSFSPLLFPPRTTDGYMGFNGFNFQV